MNDVANIEDLPVRVGRILTNEVKKELVKIVDAEFNNQATMYDAKIQEEKDKIMVAYKQKVGFEKLLEELEEAEREVERKKAKLERTGLSKSGDLQTGWNSDEVSREAARKVQTQLDKVTASIKPAANMKNKIISRLLIAENYGEAMVIIRTVLGNGIIPSVTKAELRALPQP